MFPQNQQGQTNYIKVFVQLGLNVLMNGLNAEFINDINETISHEV